MAVLQVGRGRDAFIQQCAREIWLITALNDFCLSVEHIAGEDLHHTADALSRYHTGEAYRCRVDRLVENSGITLINPRMDIFNLSAAV